MQDGKELLSSEFGLGKGFCMGVRIRLLCDLAPSRILSLNVIRILRPQTMMISWNIACYMFFPFFFFLRCQFACFALCYCLPVLCVASLHFLPCVVACICAFCLPCVFACLFCVARLHLLPCGLACGLCFCLRSFCSSCHVCPCLWSCCLVNLWGPS